MPCSICTHADQAAMVAALRHDSVRTVAERYGVSKSTLARHTKVCPTVLSPIGQAGAVVPTMGQPTPAPVHDTPPLQASHAEAQRLQHMARHAIDAFTLQRVMIGVCALLERMTAEPQAPAHVVNPTVQQQAVQLYNTLRNQSVIIDTRQAVVVAVGLLLQVVRDAGESENSH